MRPQELMRLAGILVFSVVLHAQQSQNPSPMVEHTRRHPRLPQSELPGKRAQLSTGTLFIPQRLAARKHLPLFVHFHGAGWVAEIAAQKNSMAVISVQTGSGSGVYARQFSDRALFGKLILEAEQKSGMTFDSIALTAWSAGHGAVREILATPEYQPRISRVLLIDGMHTGYTDGHPGPEESKIDRDHLDAFLQFAQLAIERKKAFLVTHSEIFPGTFASTTETADWLAVQLGLHATPVLRWGPMGTQQLSELRKGRFRLIGYAGNSAPDHVDEFHALPELLRLLRSL